MVETAKSRGNVCDEGDPRGLRWGERQPGQSRRRPLSSQKLRRGEGQERPGRAEVRDMGRGGRAGEGGEKRCRYSNSEGQGVSPSSRWTGQGPGEPSLNRRGLTTFLALDTALVFLLGNTEFKQSSRPFLTWTCYVSWQTVFHFPINCGWRDDCFIHSFEFFLML